MAMRINILNIRAVLPRADNILNGIHNILLSGALFLALSLHPAYAYIGPGGAVSGIGAFVALIAAILFAILGFIWYPIKRLLKRKNNSVRSEAGQVEEEPADTNSGMQQAEKDSPDK